MFAGGRTTKERRSEKKRKRIARDAPPVCVGRSIKVARSRPVRDTSFSSLIVLGCAINRSLLSPFPFPPPSFCQSCGHRPRCDRILTLCPFEINLAVYREPNLHRIWLSFFSRLLFFFFNSFSVSLSLSVCLSHSFF